MTSCNFIQLHVHSEYSLLDGSIRIKELAAELKKRGHTHIAVTDHGNMHGAIELYSAAKAAGLIPILGCEIYHEAHPEVLNLARDLSLSLPAGEAFHLVLLAQNTDGYHSLLRLISSGYLDGNLKAVPVVPQAAFSEHARQLVALSGCLRGEFGFLVKSLRQFSGEGELLLGAAKQAEPAAQQVYDALARHVARQKALWGAEHYYVELTNNNLAEQLALLPDLVAVARHFQLPIVATTDAHYLSPDFAETHALAVAIKNGLTMNDIRERLRDAAFHLRSDAEMAELFAAWPEALSATLEIAAKCSHLKIKMDAYYLPKIDLGTGESPVEALRRLAKKGLEERITACESLNGEIFTQQKRQGYEERLEFELAVIIQMGFPDYFLIVQDFINWAKAQGIPVGPGRGSGAGSLVAYALNITDLDPIPYNLIFERFLNPERVSMPDFDVDFCQWRRDEVIQYCVQKYGSKHVAQITTFGKMQAKGAVKSVGRALGLGYTRVDQFTKLFPPDLGLTLKDALKLEPRLQAELDKDEALQECMDYALKLEGLASHTSVHAAGLVISDGEMTDYVPIYTTDGHSYITQYEMKPTEKVGLVKFDFLGLKTLTVIAKAVELIRAGGRQDFEIAKIPLDDEAVYTMLSQGHTVGIFQCEGGGITQLILKLKPSTFEDVIALVALFRPGPLGSGMVDSFVERKHGREKIVYLHPLLEPILRDTYGMILYQEQVQKIAAVLANYSLGEADLLRRAMGKKIPEEMAQQKSRFVSGALANQLEQSLAEEIFELMAEFAKYGFNKSHSAAYGLVSYQTAYLKTYYPEEFLAASMTCDMDNTDKIIRYAEDCQRLGFQVLGPDINRSLCEFDVPRKGCVGFGLAAIKGVGAAVLKPLIAEREKAGPYQSLLDFAHRLDLGKLGKKTLQLLTAAGALDGFGYARQALDRIIPELVGYSLKYHEAAAQGQRSLFSLEASESDHKSSKNSRHGAPWDGKLQPALRTWQPEDLFSERKLLGFFLTAHPLEIYQADIAVFGGGGMGAVFAKAKQVLGNSSGKQANGRNPSVKIALVGLLTAVRTRRTKTGSLMAYLRLEEKGTAVEAMVFAKQLSQMKLPAEDTPVFVLGQAELVEGSDQLRLTVDNLYRLEEVRQERVKSLLVQINNPEALEDKAEAWSQSFKRLVHTWPGSIPLKVQLNFAKAQTLIDTSHLKVELNDQFIREFSQLNQAEGGLRYGL